jgi:hypothetical protein
MTWHQLLWIALALSACTLDSSPEVESEAQVVSPLGTWAYVATTITPVETCTGVFLGALPASKELVDDTSVRWSPISYVWDFGARLLRAERTNYSYVPAFSPGRVSSATNGRPMIRDRSFDLQLVQDDGSWKRINLLAVARASLALQGIAWSPTPAGYYTDSPEFADPGEGSESRVVFEYDCNAYAILSAGRSSLGYSLLLHSFDGGHSWAAYRIPGSEGFSTAVAMEVPSRPGALRNSPAITISQFYPSYDPSDPSKYVSPNVLKLVVAAKNPDRTLSLSPPTIVATHTISEPNSAGDENVAVSVGDLVHVVYPGEFTSVDTLTGRRGTPAYVTSYSRSQGKVVTTPTFLGVGVNAVDYTPVVADDHNQPSIAVDLHDRLHVVIGGHGGPIYYRKATLPNSSSSWGVTEVVGQKRTAQMPWGDEYTYPSIVTGVYDEPVITARWSGDGYIFRLVSISKNANTGLWLPQLLLVDPARVFYAHFAQKLSIDPWGRLFLNYSYLPSNLFKDEKDVLSNTYGFSLLPLNASCVPSNHNQYPLAYCEYSGVGRVNNSILSSTGLGSNFKLATTRAFFSW